MQSGNSHLDVRCRRQIDTLKIFNQNVSEVKPNEEYSVGFVLEGRQFVLNVYLNANFPNEKPKIYVSPRVQHEWIPDSSTGEVQNAPGLLNFTVHSDLGRVVHAIIREFEKTSPARCQTADAMNSMSPQQQQQQQHSKMLMNLQTAPIQSSIPELCNISLEELQKLDSDPQYLNDFVDEIPVVQRIQNDLDTLIGDVETMARESLSREHHLQELKANIETKVDEFRQLGNVYDALSARYQKKSDEFAPQHIKELLQIAATNADGVCETHVEQFLGGETDVQQFLDQYREAKRISAMRKVKEERLSHQLNEFERSSTF